MNLHQAVLSTQQAARLLSLSASSVQKMVARGELEAWVTPGGHRRILLASVQRWLQRSELSPSEVAPPPPAGSAPVSAAPRSDLHVLLAEDDPEQLQYLRLALQVHGAPMVLTQARDASQALILMERERPDLVITDLVMQPFDGFHLVRTIVAEPAWRGTEVLVISGLDDDEVQRRGGLPLGVTRHHKPLSTDRLLGFMDAVWARHQSGRRAAQMGAVAPGSTAAIQGR